VQHAPPESDETDTVLAPADAKRGNRQADHICGLSLGQHIVIGW
jgi:hypothetical protein